MIRAAQIFVAIVCAVPAFAAAAEDAKLSIVKSGGGLLVADGLSIVPLEVVIEGKTKSALRAAKITASAGKVSATRVDGDRVTFLYTVPAAKAVLQESFEVSLTYDEGERSETFPVRIPAAAPPQLDLFVEPSVLDMVARGDMKKISIAATASGGDLEGIDVAAAPGILSEPSKQNIEGTLRALALVDPVELPLDTPSYVLAVAAAASDKGFAAKAGGVPLEAPLRISVEIPPKSQLIIEGASNDPPPVTGPADGKTVIENVIVRYGTRVRAYSKKGKQRSEVSLAIPSAAPAGVALAIPGQAIADGGTGPTIIVAVPPTPFGAAPIWPDVAIEGARLVQTVKLSNDVHALVIERPTEPGVITVLLDEEPSGKIEMLPRRGSLIEMAQTYTKSDERAAVDVLVKNAAGDPTDHPEPRVRAEGRDVRLQRQGPGKYRAAIPFSFGGAQGSALKLTADLPPLELVSGEPSPGASASLTIMLKGTSAPIAAGGGSSTSATNDPSAPGNSTKATGDAGAPSSSGSGEGAKFGLAISAVVGTTFNSLILVGAGLLMELRLPFLEQRLALRTGIEFSHASGSGRLALDAQPQETRTTIAGFLIPFDLGFAVVHDEDFELIVRGGVDLRIERGVLELDGSSPGGGERTGFGAHAAIEAAFTVGAGALVLGATLGGVGANADGFSNSAGERSTSLSGPLTNVRADAGYRIWF